MTGLLPRATALTVGIALALIAGEAAVRALGVAPRVAWLAKDQFRLSANTRIGWEPIPDPAAIGAPAGTWLPSQRNSLGFRDVEHRPGRLPGTYRIVVIGDSIAKGLGVQDPADIFPSVMADRLDAAGLRADVVNLGVEGYNTQQEVEMLREKGLRFHPDLVVLAYCLNDRDWPAHHLYREMLEAEQREGGVSSARLPPWIGRSALYRFLRYRVFAGGSGRPADERIQALIDEVQRDTVDEYFGVLSDLARSHDFEVIVVIFPWLENLSRYERFEDHRRIIALAERAGFHHLDLLPMFIECERHYGHSVAADELHPNALGHRCAGLAIADRITRLAGAHQEGQGGP